MPGLKIFVLTGAMFLATPAWTQLIQVDFTREALIPEEVGGADTQGFALINQILSVGANQLVGNVAIDFDSPVSGATGAVDPALNSTYVAFAGQDLVSVSVTANGGLEETEPVSYQGLARELQLLSITSPIDTQVVLDMTYTQSATAINYGAGNVLNLRALSILEIIDATTFDLPFGTDEVFLPFRSIVGSSNCASASCTEIVADTTQITLNTNTLYWLQQTAVVSALTSGSVASVGFSAQAFSDPLFTINAEFANSNPEIASEVSINRRIVGVPEPAGIGLLALGLLGLGLAKRRRSYLTSTKKLA